MSKKKQQPNFIFNLILILIIFSYVLILFIVPSKIAFSDSTTVFVKSDVNKILLVIGIIFLIINTHICLNLFKRKIYKISSVKGKQLSVQKKHPSKIPKDLITGIILYFLISNLIIVYASFDALFSRYTLTKHGIDYYNFSSQKIQSFDLNSFDRFEIGTQVYSSRIGTSLYFYVRTDGAVNLLFMKTHNRKQVLELMAELKNSYNTTIYKNDIRRFQRKIGYANWSVEEKKLFSYIFEL